MVTRACQDPEESTQLLGVWTTPSSEEALLEPRSERAQKAMMLPVTLPVAHVLALGECWRLCGLPEGDRRRLEAPQRCILGLAGIGLILFFS